MPFLHSHLIEAVTSISNNFDYTLIKSCWYQITQFDATKLNNLDPYRKLFDFGPFGVDFCVKIEIKNSELR